MMTRRYVLQAGAAGAALLAAGPVFAEAAMEMRAIPSTGEKIPVIGMGTSGSFEVEAASDEYKQLQEVVRVFFAGGGTVIDTAPTYSNAEDILGAILAEQGLRPKCWLATKLSGVRGRDEGLEQFESTLKRLKTDKVELLQVHNLRDVDTQLALARELKKEGKVRYVGLTHYLESAQDELAELVRRHKPDFLQINYSVGARGAEKRVLPEARELGVAVMINRAFEDGRLFARVKGKELPAWAKEVGITSWAQAFLKFALSDPAVTVVIPATGKPNRQADNLQAGRGPTLDAQQRQSLIEAVG
ncbi:aldo/keto reductase [Hansschlegelia beijingensis]|uniref:Aryl-alcohol dehydrogenase-like predicted oxidoreductase n=1 Tax=Hansschlegelia beijingensis TaxID=1133344 RepID=A0A7W6GGM4_9HYPH|nr:aldo/keto reductase [Hansschlegelia beijingensis]MBB3974268.1 aryl-alcohol dehydrogenase-like predicted oxidoreductase [Hansschlegelia beijingensis]